MARAGCGKSARPVRRGGGKRRSLAGGLSFRAFPLYSTSLFLTGRLRSSTEGNEENEVPPNAPNARGKGRWGRPRCEHFSRPLRGAGSTAPNLGRRSRTRLPPATFRRPSRTPAASVARRRYLFPKRRVFQQNLIGNLILQSADVCAGGGSCHNAFQVAGEAAGNHGSYGRTRKGLRPE